jgi:hypothetical protein
MTDIIISARGPQGCGKTTALINIIAALVQNGLVKNDFDGVVYAEEQHFAVNATNEIAGFTANQTEPSFRPGIYAAIEKERAYQNGKWGVEADDTKNTPWMWVSYITQYATKWMTGLFTIPTSSADLFRTSMIKTAAICVAAVESLDRQRLASGRAFYEEQE